MTDLTIDREGPRVSLTGELDVATVPELEAAVTAARADGGEELVIDLSGLEFMDSSGLRCLMQADDRAAAEGWRLTLVRGPDAVHRVFEVTRMDRRLTFARP